MAAFLTDCMLQFQARRALPESSRQRRWVPWPRFRDGSGALSHNLLRRTSTPAMLPSSSPDTSEYIEPRSSLAQVISNIHSLALKLHNNTCFDNKAFQNTPACLGRNALQSVLLFPGLSNRGRCRLSFKGKTCCRYTILPKPSARSLWRMQSAASNLSNFKTPLILQPRSR